MEVFQNISEAIQGNWDCTDAIVQKSDEKLSLEFSLLISESLISRTGEGGEFWPLICNFELVGSAKDGYFYREDGCFMQVKSLTEEQLVIELSQKDGEGQLDRYLFTFSKMLQ